jgi:hypothetical protein
MSGLKVVLSSGIKVKFYQGEKVKFLLKGLLFLESPEASSRSFSTKIPYDGNEQAFNYICSVDGRDKVFEYDSEIYLFDNRWKAAKLIVVSYNEEEIEIKLTIDRGYYADFGQRKLKTFQYEEPYSFRYYLSQLSSSEYTAVEFGNTSDANVTFTFYTTDDPVIGHEKTETFLYDYDGETIAEFVKRICEYFNSKIYTYRYLFVQNEVFPAIFKIYNLTFASAAPNFFVGSIVSDNPLFQITHNGSSTTNTLAALREFYNQALLNPNRDCVCFPVAAPNFFTEQNLNYWGYLNFYNPKIPGQPMGEQPFVPFANLKYVLYKTHAEAGINIGFDGFFNEELAQLYMFNQESINNAKRLPANGWKYKDAGVFFFNDIVPNITISKLVNDFRYLFNTLIDYNSRTKSISITPIQSILEKREYTDFSKKLIKGFNVEYKLLNYGLNYEWVNEPLATELLPEISPNTLANDVEFKASIPSRPQSGFIITKATKENKYYKYNSDTKEWDLYAEGLYPFVSNNQLAELTTGVSPLFTIQYPWTWINRPVLVPFDVKWLLPYTKQPGNLLPTDKNEEPHRYLFYRGMKACDVKIAEGNETYIPGEYPFGSSHNYDYQGNKVGNYSLAWNAEDGLYNKFWSNWLLFLKNTKPIKVKLNLSVDDIINLDLTGKIRLHNQLYFIDELEFEVSDKIGNCIAKLYIIK